MTLSPIDHLLHSEEAILAPKSFRSSSNLSEKEWQYQLSLSPELFWSQQAQNIDWFTPYNQVLDWQPPLSSWFLGGKLNLSYNCLDRHLDSIGEQTALIWESEPGEVCKMSYLELYMEVCKLANGLHALGIKKGDRVGIYMPLMPEAIIAMQACARIGAIHSVVFAGFSAQALRDRVHDAGCSLLITADGLMRNGKQVALKETCDQALATIKSVKHCLVFKRLGINCPMQNPRDIWADTLLAKQESHCPAEAMDSEDPLFILYTSGTTGKPKGIVHTQGGYAVAAYSTTKYVFDPSPNDIFWCTADVGWITGHTYVAYGPLLNGMTQVLYEGGPLYPSPSRFWEIIDRHQVSTLYTAPTAIRSFMRYGSSYPQKADLSSLRLLGSVGEPLNPEAWHWYYKFVGNNRCPIVDTWWQTETGAIVLCDHPAHGRPKPGFVGKPLPGMSIALLDDEGCSLEPASTGGYIAIQHPWPSMARTIWGDTNRFKQTYFSKWKDTSYFAGDSAYCDQEGRFQVLGRVDDVLNVAGHRIGTMEVESALVDHPAVAEAAVVGKKCDLKGESIAAFVTLTEGNLGSDSLIQELQSHVANIIGKIAKPERILFTNSLPKTRSGKIMRRLLRDLLEGRKAGDQTTLADPSCLEALKDALAEQTTV